MKPIRQIEAREPKLFRRLPEADFIMEIAAKNTGIGGDLLLFRGVGRASSKRLKQAKVDGVQQNDLLLSRALDPCTFPGQLSPRVIASAPRNARSAPASGAR